MAPPKKKLGDILLEMGAVDALQLRAALGHHRQWGMPLGRTLVERRICSVEQVLAALARQTGLPVIQLDAQRLEHAPARLIPKHLAERHRMIPLALEGKRNECLVVAAAAPVALDDLDAVCAAAGKIRIRALLAADDALDRAIARLYGGAVPEGAHAPPETPAFDAMPAPAPANEVVFEELALEAVALDEAVFELPTTPPPPADPAHVVGLHAVGPLSEREALFRFDEAAPDGPSPEVGTGASLSTAYPSAPAEGRVLLFGWSEEVTLALAAALGDAGIGAEAVGDDAVLSAGHDDVVISSTLALEGLLGPGERLRPRVIVCGTPDRVDMASAKALGARVYLPPPFSVVQLGVAVQRCHEAAARRRRARR